MIKIRSLHLENYRGFTDTTIEFGDHITCIAGINGAGKSSVLYAIAKSMCLLSNKASLTNKKDYMLKKDDIHRNNSQYNDFVGETTINAVFDVNEKTINTNNTISFFGGKLSTSSKSDKAELIENTDFPGLCLYSVNRYIENMESSINKEAPASDPFFMYSKILSSISDYEDFFIWFKNREDIENERILNAQRNHIDGYDYDLQLEAVRQVISRFFGKNYKARVSRIDNTLIVENNNSEISFSSLSDGEKSLFLLLGDIARRLAIASSHKFQNLPVKIDDILNTPGIVLIDEIELHLHPSWQRKICKFLTETFPNCQFVITTHSPQILGELKTDEIWLLNDFNVYRPDSSFGLTSNQILDEVMDVIDGDFSLSRDSAIAKKLQALNLAMENEKFAEAKKIIAELEETTGTNLHEAESCKIALEMMENEE